MFEESFGFNQVAIKQEKNKALSRLDVDISSEIVRGLVRPNPLIAANMSTVTNAAFYKQLYALGSFSFLHRAQTIDNLVTEIKDVAKECEWVGFSIGVGNEYKDAVHSLVHAGGNVLLIDIAHGYSDEVISLGRWCKQTFPHIKVVVGNTTNIEMMKEVSDFADGLKIGIGAGLACRTANTAGCTEKQFSVVLKFKELSKQYGIPTISCGGIREPADVVKAIAGGANGVMMGSIFAACPESAAKKVHVDFSIKKEYYGMASLAAQQQWKGGLKPGTCAEGDVVYLNIGEPVEKVVELYTGALRSGITYSGSLNVKEFQNNAKFIRLL